jgi:polyisoprenoid-binding protein YceI
MKIAGSILVLILVGAGIWYAIQTKPNAEVQNAVVSDSVVSEVSNNQEGAVSLQQIDNANIKITFKGFGPGKVHNGSFSGITSNLSTDGSNIKGDISVDLNSMTTDSEKLTGHLKSKDFFDVEKYPTAKFTAMSLVDGKLSGSLSVHGVTKNVTVNAGQPTNGSYNIMFNLNMKEFGIDQKFAEEVVELNIIVPVK